jgi:hypothetical protein
MVWTGGIAPRGRTPGCLAGCFIRTGFGGFGTLGLRHARDPLVPSQLPVSLRHREAAPPAQEGAKLVREAEGVRRNVPGFRTMIRKKNAFIDKKNAFTDSITASSRQPTGRQGPQPRSRAAKS